MKCFQHFHTRQTQIWLGRIHLEWQGKPINMLTKTIYKIYEETSFENVFKI